MAGFCLKPALGDMFLRLTHGSEEGEFLISASTIESATKVNNRDRTRNVLRDIAVWT